MVDHRDSGLGAETGLLHSRPEDGIALVHGHTAHHADLDGIVWLVLAALLQVLRFRLGHCVGAHAHASYSRPAMQVGKGIGDSKSLLGTIEQGKEIAAACASCFFDVVWCIAVDRRQRIDWVHGGAVIARQELQLAEPPAVMQDHGVRDSHLFGHAQWSSRDDLHGMGFDCIEAFSLVPIAAERFDFTIEMPVPGFRWHAQAYDPGPVPGVDIKRHGSC